MADSKFTISAPLVVSVAAALVVLGIGAYFSFSPKPAPPPPPVLTAEARDYLDSLKLSDVGMEAAESYVKSSLVEIKGKISNAGSKTVKLVEVTCVFHDVTGQIIKRERIAVAGRKTGPLAPGDTKAFHLAFDSVPENWNQAMPDLVIAQIQFG